MKIIDYHERNGMLVVTTDNPGRSEFVYPAERFYLLEQLQAEIERSIAKEAARTARRVAGTAPIKAELDSEVAKNASK